MSQSSEPLQADEPRARRRARNFLLAAGLSGGIASGATTVLNLHVEESRSELGLDHRPLDCRKRMMDSFRVRPQLCEPDSILLGSSRAKMLRDLKAGDQRFASLACDDMVPAEYDAFIRFYEEHCDKKIETAILAMDFFGSSKHRTSAPSPPKYYMDRAFSLIHRLGLFDVISIDTTLDTLSVLADGDARAQLSAGGLAETARRKWVRTKAERRRDINRLDWATKRFERDANDTDCLIPRVVEGKPALIVEEQAGEPFPHHRYYTRAYGDYELDERNRKILRQLRIDHPHVEFVPLLTPVSNILFTALWDEYDLLDELEAYTRLVVETMGEVTTFMDVSSVSSARVNWRDENHLHPQAADLMILAALGVNHPDRPPDFGIRLTRDNIDAYFSDLEPRLEALPRVRRAPRTHATLRRIAGERLAEKRRPPGWHWNDCVAWIDPRKKMRITWPEVQRPTTMNISWTMHSAIELRFVMGKQTVAVERLQRPENHYGLTVKRMKLPQEVQDRGFDAIVAALVARDDLEEGDEVPEPHERTGGIGHLRFD